MKHTPSDVSTFWRDANLQFAGVRCSLRTDNSRLIEVLSPWIDPDCKPSCDLVLQIEVNDDSGSNPERQTYFRGLQHLVVAQFGADSVFVFNLLTRRVHASVSKRFAYDASTWHQVIAPLILGVMGATIGMLPLHSACAVRGGDGLLIAGASGAGKSTMAVALAKAGLDLLSDDWTYVARRGSSLIAHGLALPVKLLPNSINFFPELSGRRTHRSMNGEIAYEVPAKETFGVNVVASCAPRWFMFIERTARGCSEIVPVSRSAALEYIDNSVERIPPELPQAIALRQRTIHELASLPCWSFRHAGSPDSGARLLETFVETQRRVVLA